ncbi:MAG: PA2779 family protein [Bacteroidota bacterium]
MSAYASFQRGTLAVIAAIILLAPGFSRAEIVDSETLATANANDAERAKVENFLEQASVAQKLQTLGVDSIAAKERVAAMSQQEIHALAQRIDTLPAGGDFSNSDFIIILLVVLLIAVIL